jgi:hypothetical protein
MADSRNQGKQATPETAHAPARPIAWRDVLRALQADETRAAVMADYRGKGHRPDDFSSGRRAREAMAEALIRAEDHLELAHPRRLDERAALRSVRAPLERELWV